MNQNYKRTRIDSPLAKSLQSQGHRIVNVEPYNYMVTFEVVRKGILCECGNAGAKKRENGEILCDVCHEEFAPCVESLSYPDYPY